MSCDHNYFEFESSKCPTEFSEETVLTSYTASECATASASVTKATSRLTRTLAKKLTVQVPFGIFSVLTQIQMDTLLTTGSLHAELVTSKSFVVAVCQCSTDTYAYTHNSDSYRLPVVGLLLLIENLLWHWWILNDNEMKFTYFLTYSAMCISGIAVVSRYSIPEMVSLSSLQFQVSHNTSPMWCFVARENTINEQTWPEPHPVSDQ